jgi:4-amino-4-deoxy-L-arabinose transferase-like glycosyltransferase
VSINPNSPPSHDPVASGLATIRRLATPEIVLLLGVFLLALALRLAWIANVDPSPTDGRFDDSTWYHYSAVSIMEGRGYTLWFRGPPMCREDTAVGCDEHAPPTAFWNVGYPLILAGLYKVVGPSVLAAKLLNVLLSASTCLLAYVVGTRVFNRRVGLVGASLLALFPGQIFYSTLVMTETISAFLLMLFLALVLILTLESVSWRSIVLIGFLLGAASLVRGEMALLFLPLIAVWAVAHRSVGKALRYGLVALAAVALVLLPWTVRNWVRLGYPVALSTGSADNLLAGHWSGADGLGTFAPGTEVNLKYADVPYPEHEVRVYKEETRRAVSYALRHPARELELIPKKLFDFYFYYGDSRSLYLVQVFKPSLGETAENWLRAAADWYYYAVIAAAAFGAPLWFSLRDPRKLLLVSAVLYYSFMFGFVFIGEPRFHNALVPVIALFAAAFFVGVVQTAWGRWGWTKRSIGQGMGPGTDGGASVGIGEG